MSAAAEYWEGLYTKAEAEAGECEVGECEGGDETAAPAQDSLLGRGYYYLEGAPGRGERA